MSPSARAFGLAAICSGLCAVTFHDFSNWQPLGAFPHREMLADVVGGFEILAGVAVQWPGGGRSGALALSAIFLAFALLGVPSIVEHPLVYNGFGNFFEQFSLFSGSLTLYACSGPTVPSPSVPEASSRLARKRRGATWFRVLGHQAECNIN